MAADSNGGRRVFSFPKPPANSLFSESGAGATATPPLVLNDGSGLFNVPFTRNNGQKTRPEGPDLPVTATGRHAQASIEAKALSDTRHELSGLEGFARSRGPISLRQLPQPSAATPLFSLAATKPQNLPSDVSKASNLLFATPHFDPTTAAVPNMISHTKTRLGNLPANGIGKPQPQQHQKKPSRLPNKSAFARSSTPAQDLSEVDSASADYGVVQAFMIAQAAKDKLLKEKVRKSIDLSFTRRSRTKLPACRKLLDVIIGGTIK
jgi:hypothetical protein